MSWDEHTDKFESAWVARHCTLRFSSCKPDLFPTATILVFADCHGDTAPTAPLALFVTQTHYNLLMLVAIILENASDVVPPFAADVTIRGRVCIPREYTDSFTVMSDMFKYVVQQFYRVEVYRFQCKFDVDDWGCFESRNPTTCFQMDSADDFMDDAGEDEDDGSAGGGRSSGGPSGSTKSSKSKKSDKSGCVIVHYNIVSYMFE